MSVPSTPLGQHAESALRWNGAGALASVGAQFLQLLVLARLLPPHEFGMAATAIAIMGFAQGFSEMGLSNALVQRAEISKHMWASAIGGSALSGMGLFLLLVVLSPVCESALHLSGLKILLVAAGMTLPAYGMGLIFQSALQRSLRFSALARAEIIAAMLSLLVALGWTLWRREAMALIAGQVALVWTRCICMALFTPAAMRGFRLHFSELRTMADFGAYQMGERVLNYAASNMDRLLVARLLGPEAAGFYVVASQIALRPMVLLAPFIFRTLFPLLSRMQADRARLSESYLRSMALLAWPTACMYGVLFVFSKPLVVLVLGENWSPVAPLLEILVGVGFIWTVSQPLASVTLALGKARMSFWINVVVLMMTVMAVWLGSRFGIQGVAWGMLLGAALLLPLDFFLMHRWLKINPIQFFKAMGSVLAYTRTTFGQK